MLKNQRKETEHDPSYARRLRTRREKEVEAPPVGRGGRGSSGGGHRDGAGTPARGGARRSRGGRTGVADYGDGRARRGGLAWRATATAMGERAEAAGWRRRAGERRRLGRRPWLTTRSHKEYGFISSPGWSWPQFGPLFYRGRPTNAISTAKI